MYNIAVGASRTQKHYKNITVTWADLMKRLETPTRTGETAAEFKSLNKAEKSRLKDVGGFVGGYLAKGLRTKVKYRSLVCLDLDYATPESDVWDLWQTAFGSRAALYSTHSHTPEAPRLRLVAALSRPVTPDEYQAISRKIADSLGMEMFDPTTFEPARLMYWPSCPKDGQYIFRHCDGKALDPNEILDRYEDWKDVSSWATGNRAEKLRLKAEKKMMQAVADKRGPIGAFCRAYDIHEAIAAFVPDYQRSDAAPDRYTYVKGSTANGVVTYNGTFSYSHHATDPASGREVNAFDLVRLHRFGALDEDAVPETPVTKLPSYRAMVDFALKDEKCKLRLIEERTAEAENDFEDESGTEDAPGSAQDGREGGKVQKEAQDTASWKSLLDLGEGGRILSSYKNIRLILAHDEKLKGLWGFDEFAQREVAVKDLPWRKISKMDSGLKDIDDAQVRIRLSEVYGVIGKDKIWDCLLAECHKKHFHPVREYLDGLKWDGIKRLDTLLVDYFGCDNTEYIRAVTRKTLLGAVTRVFEPGCQFDTMLTLKGPQGCGKSSFFRKLSKGWFSDSLKDIRSKDAYEGLQGAWIIEMGELAAMKKADAEVIKSFLSGTVDRFRVAYGRRTGTYPRQCIFIATTNEVEFLRDRTGNRRFWIACIPKGRKPEKDVFKISAYEIDQIWAETKALYDSKTETVVLSKELEQEAIRLQENFMQEDPRTAQIVDYLNRHLPKDWPQMDLKERRSWLDDVNNLGTETKDRTCVAEIWCEALKHDDTKNLDRYEAVEINRILDSLPDWERSPRNLWFKGYGAQKGFTRVKKQF